MQWGEECQNKCGNCKELPCDIQTGHCERGCAGPWIPPLCVKGISSTNFIRRICFLSTLLPFVNSDLIVVVI